MRMQRAQHKELHLAIAALVLLGAYVMLTQDGLTGLAPSFNLQATQQELLSASTAYSVGQQIRTDTSLSVGTKTKDDTNFEVRFLSVAKSSEFRLQFFHDSAAAQPVAIGGITNYALSNPLPAQYEVVTLIVPLVSGRVPQFTLRVGSASEEFSFGESSGGFGSQSNFTAQAVITSCGNVNESSTLGSDISGSGTCLSIVTGGITLNCLGFHIRYGTSGASDVNGILVSDVNGVTVQNCIIEDGSGTGFRDPGIQLFNSNSNTFTNNQVVANGSGDPNMGVVLINSNSSSFTDLIISGGSLRTELAMSNSKSNTFTGTILNSSGPVVWINSSQTSQTALITPEPLTNTFTDTTFNGGDSLAKTRFTDSFTINRTRFINGTYVTFSNSKAFVHPAATMLNQSARVTLKNIAGTDFQIGVDYNEDSIFEHCPPAQCTEVSTASNSYVFDVTRWTAYSVQQNPADGCSTVIIPDTYTLTQNIAATGDCYRITVPNVVLDCNNFNITGTGNGTAITSVADNTTVRNCNIRNFQTSLATSSGNNINVTNVLSLNSSVAGFGISFSGNGRFVGNTILANGGPAVRIRSSAGNIFVNNTINSSSSHGIETSINFGSQSNGMVIRGNNITVGNGTGIYGEGSSHVIIEANNITSVSGRGIVLAATDFSGNPTLSFTIDAFNGSWHSAGTGHFPPMPPPDMYATKKFTLPEGTTKVRLTHANTDTAHIDAALLDGAAPARVTDESTGAELPAAKLAAADYDVIDGAKRTIEIEWESPGTMLTVVAVEEDLGGLPFAWPESGLDYYTVGGSKEFVYYAVPTSAHPSSNIYASFTTKSDALRLDLDVTMDNTYDYDGDWAELRAFTREDMRSFRLNNTDSTWGAASFGYTDKVSWQHKIYNFTIPLSEIPAREGEEIRFQLGYYGTGSLQFPCTNNTLVSNNISSQDHAIAFGECTYDTIINNNASSVTGIGIYFQNSQFNNLTNNTASSVNNSALEFNQSSYNNSVTNISAISFRGKGIHIVGSNSINVTIGKVSSTFGEALLVNNSLNSQFSNNSFSTANGSSVVLFNANIAEPVDATSDLFAKSGSIGDNQESNMTLTQTIPPGGANISFTRKVSSEASFDFLRFYIDATLQDSYSGEVAFSAVTFNVTAGTHTFTWRYVKDSSVSSGQDAAWVDDVTITNASGTIFSDGFEDETLSPFSSAGAAQWEVVGFSTNAFIHSALLSNNTWIFTDSNTKKTTFNVTLFDAVNGSIRFPGTFTVPASVNASQSRLNVTFNNATIDSANLTFLNTFAAITLRGLIYTDPAPIIGSGSNASSIFCSACTKDGYTNGTFVYNVSGFTFYSSEEAKPNITITIIDDPDPVGPNSLLNYTIVVTNTGSGNATNVTVYETLQGGVNLTSATPSPVPGTGNTTFVVGNLTPGAVFRINKTVFIPNLPSGTVITDTVNATYGNSTAGGNSTFDTNSTTQNTTVSQSCPLVVTANTTLTQNLTCPATAISIQASGVVLDCAGYTVTWDAAGGGNDAGVLSVGRENLTIKDCFIRDGNASGAAGFGINFTAVNNSLVVNNTIRTNGTLDNFVVFMNISNRNRIENNTIIASGSSSNNRGFHLVISASNSIVGNAISTGGTSGDYGIAILLSAGNIIANNSISTNGSSLANFGIVLTAGTDSSIYNNSIQTSGTDSNDGIALSAGADRNNFTSNMIIARGSGNGSDGVSLDGSSSNVFGLNTINATANSSHGIKLANGASSNAFIGSVISTTGLGSYGVQISSSSPAIFNGTILYGTTEWINSSDSTSSNFTNTTFLTASGSIRVQGIFTANESKDATRARLNISSNRAFLNSTNLSFINTSAQITLNGISFTDPVPVVDLEDDGSFTPCGPPQCIELSYAGGVFVFNVTRFTSYAANETAPGLNISNLTIVKTGFPDPVGASSDLNYTINVTSTGNGTALNVTVNDTFPSQVVFLASSPAPDSALTNNTWFLGNLTPGTSVQINITVRVLALPNGSVINNSANATFATLFNTTPSALAIESTTILNVTPLPLNFSNISIVKTDFPDPVNASSNLTYTINVTSTGNATAFNVTVNDTFPLQTTFLTSSPAPTTPNNTWFLGNLTPGTSIQINITVLVTALPDGTTIQINNTANASFVNASNATITFVARQNTTVTTPPVPLNFSNITIVKTDFPDPVNASSNLTYIINVTSTGNATAFNVTVNDTLPSSLVFLTSQPVPTTPNNTWFLGNLTPGQSVQINITVLTPSVPPGSGLIVVNVANASFVNASNATNTIGFADTENTTIVNTTPNFSNVSIVKTDFPDPVNGSQLLNYTINVTSTGNVTAFNVTVNDTLPAQVVFVSAVPAPTTPNSTFFLGNLTPGVSVQINITVLVLNLTNNTRINNTANVSFVNASNATLSFAVNISTIVLNVTPPFVPLNFSNITVIKTDAPDPVNATLQLNYTINVTSSGNATAFNVTVNESFPAQIVFNSSQPAPDSSATNNTWFLGNLTPGTSVLINISVIVANITNGTLINNTANVSFVNASNATLSAAATASTTVLNFVPPPIPGVNITTNSTNATTAEGVNVTYLITVGNNGTATNTYNLTVQNLDGATTAALNVSQVTIPVNATMNVLLTVTNTTFGFFRVTVTALMASNSSVNATTPEINTTVVRTFGVSISASPSAQSTTPSVTVAYTITVTNNGSAINTYNLTVQNVSGAGTVTINQTNFTLASGSSATATLTVGNSADGVFTVTVTALMATNSSINGTATTTTTVATPAPPTPGGGGGSGPAVAGGGAGGGRRLALIRFIMQARLSNVHILILETTPGFANFTFTQSNMSLYSLDVDFRKPLVNATINISRRDPAPVQQFAELTYQTFEVELSKVGDAINEIAYYLVINNSWLEGNDIVPGSIVAWELLPNGSRSYMVINHIGDLDDIGPVYKIVLPDFRNFSISAVSGKVLCSACQYGEWGACSLAGTQSRDSYTCGRSTQYACKEFRETRVCSSPVVGVAEPAPFCGLVNDALPPYIGLIIIISFLAPRFRIRYIRISGRKAESTAVPLIPAMITAGIVTVGVALQYCGVPTSTLLFGGAAVAVYAIMHYLRPLEFSERAFARASEAEKQNR